MKVVDLSHIISCGMPVYPGTENPKILEVATISSDGFSEREFTLSTHTGTHVDAPSHIISDGRTLDCMNADTFVGQALIIKIDEKNISLEFLKTYEPDLKGTDYVLLKTGHSSFWGSDKYFDSYPILDQDAAVWLSEMKLKGIGIDAVSVDSFDSIELPIHRIFLEKGVLIIENLTNLEKLDTLKFQLVCAPLNLEGADGSPTRVFGILP